MELSQTEFNQNARALVSALVASQQEENDNEATQFKSDEWLLSNWRLKCGTANDRECIYLVHPPILVVSKSYEPSEGTTGGEIDFVGDSLWGEQPLLEDTTILEDTESIIHQTNHEHLSTTQWSFSIVYSDTYRVPVLYFYVQEKNGSPCSRQHVLEILKGQMSMSTCTDDIPQDTWEFMSQEEHPYTGIPSFFLHPCQSSQKLQLLLSSSNRTASPTGNDTESSEGAESFKCAILWTWMSMILPAVGHPIGGSYFLAIQDRVMNQQEKQL
jgi:hypothetical protein